MAVAFFWNSMRRTVRQKKDLAQRTEMRAGFGVSLKPAKYMVMGLHTGLEDILALDPNVKISYHKYCVSKYTSKTNVSRHHSHTSLPEDGPVKKRLRKSTNLFNFRECCIYCGEVCNIEKDTMKNPSRWRPSFLIRATHRTKDNQKYTQRGDCWQSMCSCVCRELAISDLHAAEARYQSDCMTRFRSRKGPVNLQYASATMPTSHSIPCLNAFHE